MPIIRSKGIRVQTIVIAFHRWNESVAEIAKQYDLPQLAVKESLSFYLAHKTAVDSLINDNNALEGEHV